jgi:hypothetical protein
MTTNETGAGGTSSTTESSGGGGAGGGPSCDHVGTAMCESALDLSTGNEFDGDEDNQVRIEHGEANAWYRLTITEGSDGDNDISYSAVLTNPPGMQYDLFIYGFGDDKGVTPACMDNAMEATGSPPTIHECWSDSFIISTDDRDRLFEVRYVSGGACGVDAQWTLTFTGNVDNGSCP